jgi:4-amino-4-deoxy-L-arabinose transferase-like glycosyltransferase
MVIFKKHNIVFSRYSLILLGILILGTFLRFYRLPQNLNFTGEVGYDYMTIRTFVENHQIPLIGPRTSHEWLFLGPIYYWVFGILLPLFNYNVTAGSYFFATVGVTAIFICYWVIKQLFGQKVGLISSFLLAFSPLWLKLTRDARYDSPTAVLFFLFYYFLVKSVKDAGKSLFILGIILGSMFSFFPSPIVLLPCVIAVILIYRKRIDAKYFLPGILGFIIPNITYFIYNAEHKFELLINIFTWVPYRILGFFGIVPKNTVTPGILQNNFTGLYTFFQQSYFHDTNVLILLISLAALGFAFTRLKKNLPLQILLIIFGVSYLGLFLHGDPPLHYYYVIFPVPIILLSLLLERIGKKFLWVTVLVLGYLLIANLGFYFSDQWFYKSTSRMSDDMTYVPHDLQVKVADFIVKDAGSNKFSLARVGPYDYFEENFALNYHYLLWGLGNKPDDAAKLRYTIYEDTLNLSRNAKIVWIENIAVLKNE